VFSYIPLFAVLLAFLKLNHEILDSIRLRVLQFLAGDVVLFLSRPRLFLLWFFLFFARFLHKRDLTTAVARLPLFWFPRLHHPCGHARLQRADVVPDVLKLKLGRLYGGQKFIFMP